MLLTSHPTLVFVVIPLFSTRKDTPLFLITQFSLKINYYYTLLLLKWDEFFNSRHYAYFHIWHCYKENIQIQFIIDTRDCAFL